MADPIAQPKKQASNNFDWSLPDLSSYIPDSVKAAANSAISTVTPLATAASNVVSNTATQVQNDAYALIADQALAWKQAGSYLGSQANQTIAQAKKYGSQKLEEAKQVVVAQAKPVVNAVQGLGEQVVKSVERSILNPLANSAREFCINHPRVKEAISALVPDVIEKPIVASLKTYLTPAVQEKAPQVVLASSSSTQKPKTTEVRAKPRRSLAHSEPVQPVIAEVVQKLVAEPNAGLAPTVVTSQVAQSVNPIVESLLVPEPFIEEIVERPIVQPVIVSDTSDLPDQSNLSELLASPATPTENATERSIVASALVLVDRAVDEITETAANAPANVRQLRIYLQDGIDSFINPLNRVYSHGRKVLFAESENGSSVSEGSQGRSYDVHPEIISSNCDVIAQDLSETLVLVLASQGFKVSDHQSTKITGRNLHLDSLPSNNLQPASFVNTHVFGDEAVSSHVLAIQGERAAILAAASTRASKAQHSERLNSRELEVARVGVSVGATVASKDQSGSFDENQEGRDSSTEAIFAGLFDPLAEEVTLEQFVEIQRAAHPTADLFFV